VSGWRPPRDRGAAAPAAWWDPFTFRQLEAVGVGRGWNCLAIGAGAGSVGAWLVERVGRDGHVVATDIETGVPGRRATLEVRHHEAAGEPITHAGYDLIHARLLLEQLPGHGAVVTKLVAGLRDGGWLVVEGHDGTRVCALLRRTGLREVRAERVRLRTMPMLVVARGRRR
jgi:hypothetical protein